MKSRIARVFAMAGMCGVLTGGAAASSGDTGSYMIVDLKTGVVTYETGVPSDYTGDTYKTTKMVLRRIPAGREYDIKKDNSVAVQADIAKDYYLGVYEVTVGQYELLQNPGASVEATEASMKPRGNVGYSMLRGTMSAADAPTDTSPIGRLTALVHASGTASASYLFDLPTEAMWEVAARAMESGDSSHVDWAWFFGMTDSNLDSYAWHAGNAGSATHVVGLKLPNCWGFYDMYGNVSEWCRDHWSWIDFVPTQIGNATAAGGNRSIRGGSYEDDGNICSSGMRMNAYCTSTGASIGFRLAWTPADPDAEEPEKPQGVGEGSVGEAGVQAPACLSGTVAITTWRPLAGNKWRLVLTAPESALKGDAENLVPNGSFSLRYSTGLSALNMKGGGNCGDILDFTIDDVATAEGRIALTLTVTVDVQENLSSLFVKVVDPVNP